MKIQLPFNMTQSEIDLINSSNTKKTKTQRINKIVKTKTNFNSLILLLDTLESNLIRCFWCNSVTKIKNFNVENINNFTFLTDVTQIDNIKNCKRNDTLSTKNCNAKKLNPNSLEYVKNSLGFKTDKEAKKYLLERNKSLFYRHNHKSDEEYRNYQRRDKNFFGTEEKWKKYCERQAYTNSLEYFKEKYGDDKGLKKWDEYNKSKDSSSLNHFLKKYGNTIEAYIKYDQRCKSSDSSSKKYYIKKYGEIEGNKKWEYIHTLPYYIERYGYQNGNRIFNNIKLKENKTTCKSSKESLINLFIPLIKEYEKQYTYKYFIGYNQNKEYFLKDSNGVNRFFDFCIPDLKIIVEYHGSMFHYNKNFNYKSDKNHFGQLFEDMKLKDKNKKQTAINYGYTYIEVFDTDNFKEKINEILQLIKLSVN